MRLLDAMDSTRFCLEFNGFYVILSRVFLGLPSTKHGIHNHNHPMANSFLTFNQGSPTMKKSSKFPSRVKHGFTCWWWWGFLFGGLGGWCIWCVGKDLCVADELLRLGRSISENSDGMESKTIERYSFTVALGCTITWATECCLQVFMRRRHWRRPRDYIAVEMQRTLWCAEHDAK